jgi:hypothetical protein
MSELIHPKSGQTIMVAIDESPNSREAFEMCLKILKPQDSLILAHIVEIQETSIFDPFHEPLDRIWNLEQREKAKSLQQTYESLCQHNKVCIFVRISLTTSP